MLRLAPSLICARRGDRCGRPRSPPCCRGWAPGLAFSPWPRGRRPAGWRACGARRCQATTNRRQDVPAADNRIGRPFRTARPTAVGLADLPCGPTDEGGCYWAPGEDGATRPIGGGAGDRGMTQALTLTALPVPWPAGVLHHSDRGSPYAPAARPARWARSGMTASVSRQGTCGDNVCIAPWHRLITKELVQLHHVGLRAEARLAVVTYSEIWYNRPRRPRAGGYRPPGGGRSRATGLRPGSPLSTVHDLALTPTAIRRSSGH